MKTLLALGLAGALTGAAAPAASAAEVTPAVLYGFGGKFDHSFNEGVYTGVQDFTKATGIAVREFEPQAQAQLEQALRNFASRGQDPILAVGFEQASAVKTVAAEFPKIRFAIIDAVVAAPNVQSITFSEEQGSYLAGMLAAMAASDHKIGFVGGMDIPLIRKFSCGYIQGAKAVDPKIELVANMTGNTPAAWNDPVRGGELARSQVERGANVVFAAAGATGVGVLQAVADAGKLGVGVDSNQNYLHPGHMLTSMVKRVDVAARTTFEQARAGSWKPGVTTLGLAQDGVGVAFDQYNKDLITADMKARVDQARGDIIAGKIVVHDYTTDGKCPD